jgi:hypothetical protein
MFPMVMVAPWLMITLHVNMVTRLFMFWFIYIYSYIFPIVKHLWWLLHVTPNFLGPWTTPRYWPQTSVIRADSALFVNRKTSKRAISQLRCVDVRGIGRTYETWICWRFWYNTISKHTASGKRLSCGWSLWWSNCPWIAIENPMNHLTFWDLMSYFDRQPPYQWADRK